MRAAVLSLCVLASAARADDVVLDQLDRCLGEEFAARVAVAQEAAPCASSPGGCTAPRAVWEGPVEERCVRATFDHCLVRPEPDHCYAAVAATLILKVDLMPLPTLEEVEARDDLDPFERRAIAKARRAVDARTACPLDVSRRDPALLRRACSAHDAAMSFLEARKVTRRLRLATGEAR